MFCRNLALHSRGRDRYRSNGETKRSLQTYRWYLDFSSSLTFTISKLEHLRRYRRHFLTIQFDCEITSGILRHCCKICLSVRSEIVEVSIAKNIFYEWSEYAINKHYNRSIFICVGCLVLKKLQPTGSSLEENQDRKLHVYPEIWDLKIH